MYFYYLLPACTSDMHDIMDLSRFINNACVSLMSNCYIFLIIYNTCCSVSEHSSNNNNLPFIAAKFQTKWTIGRLMIKLNICVIFCTLLNFSLLWARAIFFISTNMTSKWQNFFLCTAVTTTNVILSSLITSVTVKSYIIDVWILRKTVCFKMILNDLEKWRRQNRTSHRQFYLGNMMMHYLWSVFAPVSLMSSGRWWSCEEKRWARKREQIIMCVAYGLFISGRKFKLSAHETKTCELAIGWCGGRGGSIWRSGQFINSNSYVFDVRP